MSKQITALLLQRKVEKLKNVDARKNYLISCLKLQGFIKEEIQNEFQNVPVSSSICKICNSGNLIRTNHEEICQQCGATESRPDINPFRTFKQDINFSKSSFIEPGTLIIDVMKDGNRVRRDLSNLNTWLTSDPEEQRIAKGLKKLEESLETLSSQFNPMRFENVKKIIQAMWYNALIVYKDMRGKQRIAILIWCIYYPLVYNDMKINIQKLVSMFDIQIGELYSYNFMMKDIFSKTSYEKYISLPIGTTSDIEIPEIISRRISIAKRNLKDYLSNPLKDKELYGLIYYISKNINYKQFTLAYLAEKSGLSTVLISSFASRIETFYKKNPSLRNILLN